MTITLPARKRIVASAWKRDRKVRILTDELGYGGKIGIIRRVSDRFIYVGVRYGKKPEEQDELAFPRISAGEKLRLI